VHEYACRYDRDRRRYPGYAHRSCAAADGRADARSTDGGPAGVNPCSTDLQPPQLRTPELHGRQLAGRFPTQIDGRPVTGVRTLLYMEFLLGFAPDKADEFRAAMSSVGIDANAMSAGTASATVGGETVRFVALRVPGGDANTIVENLVALGSVLDPDRAQSTLMQVSIGGKNVTKATDLDGDVTYVYATGDILWLMDDIEETRAAKILAVLP
jgi:hypothetical protein